MELDELITKLNQYPKGYISTKKIKGGEYFYLQNKCQKRVLSRYIPKEEVEEVRKQLIERERLEIILEEFINRGEEMKRSLSKNDEELTGYVMSGNLVVAKVKNDNVIWKDERCCPLILTRSNHLTPFLKKRIFDESRVNTRLLKKALFTSESGEKLSLKVNASSITDNFWFRPRGSRLVYEDVKFKSDNYAEVSLCGDMRFTSKKPRKTPQITLVGSYEKCWKLINGDWWLYKVGNKNEIFSEIFCSKFAELIDVPTAFYEQDGKFIRTKNFADGTNFEPISSLAGEDDSYDNVFKTCLNISEDIAKQYITLIYFDALVENVDRHNENLGFLRHKRNGKILSLAPNFDNNVSLISRSNVLNENREHFGLTKTFGDFLKSNKKAMELFKTIELVEVNEELISECFRLSNEKEINQNISRFLINGFKYLKEIQKASD